MDTVFRKAEPPDAERINELFIEMLQSVYHTDDVSGYEEGYLERYFTGSGDCIYLARQGKETVAFLSVQVFREDGYIYLDDLSVTEKCRNCGIGTKLIRMAEGYAKDTGIRAVVLHVEKSNVKARRLYIIPLDIYSIN